MSKNQLWSRWTLANALSEMIGLGLTFAITGLFFSSLGEQNSIHREHFAFFPQSGSYEFVCEFEMRSPQV